MTLPTITDKLSSEQLEALSKVCRPCLFQTESEIIYEGHTPIAGYCIIQGEVEFYKKKKLINKIGAGNMFGVHELLNSMPLKYTAKIKPNSTVCILDKSTIKELLHRIEQNDFPRIFDAHVT